MKIWAPSGAAGFVQLKRLQVHNHNICFDFVKNQTVFHLVYVLPHFSCYPELLSQRTLLQNVTDVNKKGFLVCLHHLLSGRPALPDGSLKTMSTVDWFCCTGGAGWSSLTIVNSTAGCCWSCSRPASQLLQSYIHQISQSHYSHSLDQTSPLILGCSQLLTIQCRKTNDTRNVLCLFVKSL